MPEVVIREGPINTLNDLMDQVQEVFLDLRKGKITEATSNALCRCSKVQVDIAKLGIQYMRLMRPRSGSSKRGQVPILPGVNEETPLPTPKRNGRKKTNQA